MSLLSKLFGDQKSGESTLDAFKKAAQNVVNEATNKLNEAAEQLKEQNGGQQSGSVFRPFEQPAPRRSSAADSDWPEDIPAEENQYNFSGTHIQYFEKVFREEFPGYVISIAEGMDANSPVFYFNAGGRYVLAVELKSERSSAQRIRRACESNGIPYLRFYYDHDGWWNTRSYVVDRVRKALNM